MLRRLAVVVALLVCLAAPVTATEFGVQPDAGSQVEFVSKAPMETFSGKTRKVSGRVALDPAQLADSIEVRIEVDLASLDTGIGLRNTHMRTNHLHTDRFPKAVFQGGRLANLSAPVLVEGQKVTATITGTMDLHGVQKRIQAPVEMTYKGGALHVVSHFKIKLGDYDIPRPQFLVMRLDESQSVVVDLHARPLP